jgi:hypothetical protein
MKFWREKHFLSFKEDQELWSKFDEAQETLTEVKLKDMIWNKFQEDKVD